MVKKSTTGLAVALEKHSNGNHGQGDLLAGSSRVTLTNEKEKDKRQKWSREDFKEGMYVFYMPFRKAAGIHTENTFSIWRSRNHNAGMNLNEDKLENERKDIMNKKRLTDIELREIKENVLTDVKDRDSGNVGIRDEDVDDRDEGTGSTSYKDADTRKRYADQRENVNHTGTLGDIPIDEGSGDKFELVHEGNHNVSYDATGNNIIMSHPSVNEKGKIITNPKKRKTDLTGKENNDVEFIVFRNEIIETTEKTEPVSMSEVENLTKVKLRNSQKKYLNFANLPIQEFCDDIELDMNDANTILYACARTVGSKLGVKPKKKIKTDKNNKPKWKINIEK